MPDKAFFIGNHLALDFLNSIAAPRGEPIESISDGAAYMAWLTDAQLLHPSETEALLDRFGRPALDRVASEARDLRAWFRQVITKPAGPHARGRAAEELDRLNQILAMDCSYRQLEESDRRLVLRERREFTRVRQLLDCGTGDRWRSIIGQALREPELYPLVLRSHQSTSTVVLQCVGVR